MSVKYKTIDDLAKTLSVSVSTVRSWIKKNIIPKSTYIKVGSTYRFDLDHVIESLKNLEVNDDLTKLLENTNSNNDKIHNIWGDEKINLLKKLWFENISISQIGLEIGVSRNAVAGKAHRLGLPKRLHTKEYLDNMTVQYENGHNFEHGINGKEQNYKQAFKYYKLSSDQGYYLAQYALALLYFSGNGVDKNIDQAFKYFRFSAEQEYDKAQYAVGMFYHSGLGVKENKEEAYKYYKLSADQGNEDAQYALANFYFIGYYPKKDAVEAFKYYKLSADHNHFDAQFMTGTCYLNGFGVVKNNLEAGKYFVMSYISDLNDENINLSVSNFRFFSEQIEFDEFEENISISEAVRYIIYYYSLTEEYKAYKFKNLSDQDTNFFNDFEKDIHYTLETLTDKEKTCIELRYGISQNNINTLQEIGNRFNLSRERIRQIIAKGIRKLKHPIRTRGIKKYALDLNDFSLINYHLRYFKSNTNIPNEMILLMDIFNIDKKYISVLGSFLRKLSDDKTKNQLDIFFKKNTQIY